MKEWMYGWLLLLIRFALPLVIGFWAVICLLAMLATNTRSWAAEPADSEAVQIVGFAPVPPFAMKDGEGNWEVSTCGGMSRTIWGYVSSCRRWRFPTSSPDCSRAN